LLVTISLVTHYHVTYKTNNKLQWAAQVVLWVAITVTVEIQIILFHETTAHRAICIALGGSW